MTRTYSIPATWEQMDGDVQVGEVDAVIHFTCTPGGGDGWNEPRYDAEIELHHVEYSWSGSAWPKEMLEQAVEDWAESWLEKNYDPALAIVNDDLIAAQEYAAEMRADMRREDRS